MGTGTAEFGARTGPVVVRELRDLEVDADIAILLGESKGRRVRPPAHVVGREVETLYEHDRLWYDGRSYIRNTKVTIEYPDGATPRVTYVLGVKWKQRHKGILKVPYCSPFLDLSAAGSFGHSIRRKCGCGRAMGARSSCPSPTLPRAGSPCGLPRVANNAGT